MADFLQNITGWVKRMFYKNIDKSIYDEAAVSPAMAAAVEEWLELFYLDLSGKDRNTANFAEILTGYMASLATNEIKLSCGAGARAEYIEEQIKRHVLSQIGPAVQLVCAGGAAALKPYVYRGDIHCMVIDARNFLPLSYTGSHVTGAAFFENVWHGGKLFTKVERQYFEDGGEYVITQKAYNAGGREVPLDKIPEWAGLAPETRIRDLEGPLFGVLRTARANNVDGSRAPVSAYSSAVSTLLRLESILRQIDWEIETGKRRQIIDASAIDPAQRIDKDIGRIYPVDQYIVLNSTDGKLPFDDYTPQMRIQEYQKAMDTELRMLEMQAGLSIGSLNIEGVVRSGTKTATEIISEDRTTYNTIRALQENGLRGGLLDVIYAYDVYATLGDLAPGGEIDPTVEFGDSIFEDTATEFNRRMQLANNGYTTKENVVEWYFGVDEETAKKEYMPAQGDDALGDYFGGKQA